MNIAIDGPAGAGKSTIAKAVAKRLGYIYVDTGAMYRGIGLYALEHGADPKSAKEVGDILDDIAVSIKYKDGEQRLLLNGEDVSDRIRTPEVSAAASAVSALPAVREKLLDLQRELARNNDAVMDGRGHRLVRVTERRCKDILDGVVGRQSKAQIRRACSERNKG